MAMLREAWSACPRPPARELRFLPCYRHGETLISGDHTHPATRKLGRSAPADARADRVQPGYGSPIPCRAVAGVRWLRPGLSLEEGGELAADPRGPVHQE